MTVPVAKPAVLDPEADCAEDLAGVLVSLLEDLRFAELGEAVRSLEALRGPDRRRVLDLCRAGRRLLDLDAVGLADDEGLDDGVRDVVRAMQFPSRPQASPRGSLQSLAPLYGLLLESLRVHWSRGETARVTLLLHLMAEYLPLLAWESALGHAGDPLPLREHVAGTLWATPECPAPRNRRSAAERVLALDPGSPEGIQAEQWKVYLDRWHARVAAMLRQCALRPGEGRPHPDGGGCDRPCGVATRLPADTLQDLAGRMALATAFAESPVVALRHAAPVGHFFGVPDAAEVSAQWKETVDWLCRDWSVGRASAGRVVNPVAAGLPAEPGEPLPGLRAFLSTVAAQDLAEATVLHELRDAVAVILAPLLGRHDACAS